jgi:hypothetical protein
VLRYDAVNAFVAVPCKDPVILGALNEPVTVVVPITFNEPVILADPVYGKAEPPPLELIVTTPKPFVGDIVTFVPATIEVTPPFKAYDELKA